MYLTYQGFLLSIACSFFVICIYNHAGFCKIMVNKTLSLIFQESEMSIMNRELLAKMERNIKELKCRLSQYDTESVLGMIGTELSVVHDYKSIFEKTKLSSPLKQYLYLAGLLMSTNQVETLQLNKRRIDYLKQLLEEVTKAYALMYFYGAKDVEESVK